MHVMCVCVYTHTAVQKICKSEFSSAFTPVCPERVHNSRQVTHGSQPYFHGLPYVQI